MKLTKGDVAHLTALMMGPAEFSGDQWTEIVAPLKATGVWSTTPFTPKLVGRGGRAAGQQMYYVTDEAKQLVANWEE